MKKFSVILLLPLLFYSSVFSQSGVDKPIYQILTNRAGSLLGTFNVELFPLIAPLHVHNFDSLVNDQFFDSTAFHRVVPGFVIQGGDPNSIHGPVATWGQGQPWQVTVPAEFSAVRHLRGILGAARDTDINSANSQFYICVANATFLDGNYTVYGKVVSGMSVVDTIVNSPRDANDVPLQKIEMFVTHAGFNDSIPDSPTLNGPVNGAIGILNTQNFTWSSVNSAVLYTIELSQDPSFSVVDISVNSGTNSTLVTALGGSTLYYWRVKSNNGGHESAYSNVYSFNSATAAPQLIYPWDTATTVSLDPVFTWSQVPGADSYTLQVSTSATFTTQTMIYNTAGLTGTSQQVSGLNPNALYYWRVRSAMGSTQGFYSLKYSFTTGTASGLSTQGESAKPVSIFPNPAGERVTLDLLKQENGMVNISLYDLTGRMVVNTEELSHEGRVILDLGKNQISPGLYFLIAEIDGAKVTGKISIVSNNTR